MSLLRTYALPLLLATMMVSMRSVHATCSEPNKVVSSTCTSPNNQGTQSAPPATIVNAKSRALPLTGQTAEFTPTPTGAAYSYEWSAIRAHTLKIASFNTGNSAIWINIYEDDVFVATYQQSITNAVLYSQMGGRWKMQLVAWTPGTYSISLDSFAATAECVSGDFAIADAMAVCSFTCPSGQHLWRGTCTAIPAGADVALSSDFAERTNFAIPFSFTDTSNRNIAPGQAIVFTTQFGDMGMGDLSLVFSATAVSTAWTYVYIYEGSAVTPTTSFRIAAPFSTPVVTPRTTGTTWTVKIVNWAAAATAVLVPAQLEMSHICTNDKPFNIWNENGWICATPCPAPQQDPGTGCKNPTKSGKLTSTSSPPTLSAVVNAKQKTLSADYNAVLFQAGQGRAYEWTNIRAHKLAFNWNTQNDHCFINVYEDGILRQGYREKATNVEFFSQGSGLWMVEIVLWKNAMTFQNFNKFTGSVHCVDGEFVVGADGISACTACPAGQWAVQGVCTSIPAATDVPAEFTTIQPASARLEPVSSATINIAAAGQNVIMAAPDRLGDLSLTFAGSGMNAFAYETGTFTGGWTYALVYENNVLVSSRKIAAPFNTPVVIPGTGAGTWSVRIVNWAPAAAAAFDPAQLQINVVCPAGHTFAGSPLKCTVTTAPKGCAYRALGFNPWEQWNVFSFSSATFENSRIGGGVAAAGDVTAANGAHVHADQPFKSSKPRAGQQWSITADGVVTLDGTDVKTIVSNGGIQATKTIAKTNNVQVTGDEFPNTELSVDLSVAEAYFTDRAEEWAKVVDTHIDVDPTDKSEIIIRVNGKVNFVNEFSAEDLALARRIVLVGNPQGTVVINVAGTDVAEIEDLEVVFKTRPTDAGLQPTFGRVLLNFHSVTSLKINKLAQDGGRRRGAIASKPALHASILAPKAVVTIDQGEVKGNVIAKEIQMHGDVGFQPFGTPARKLTPVPPVPARPWTPVGRRNTECLWHTL